nr:uncharacterized protein LOC123769337 [Procambarus clarkii]
MTSRERSTVIRRPNKGKCGSSGLVKGVSTTYARRNLEELHEVDTQIPVIGEAGPSSESGGAASRLPSTSDGGSHASESQLEKDNGIRSVIRHAGQPKAESIVHLTDRGGGVGGTTVSLSPGTGPGGQPQPPWPTLPTKTNISMKRQLTRPERHDRRGSSEGGRGGGGSGGEAAGEARAGECGGGASYSRAVASEREAAITVTVSDTSSVDSPLLSPHHPLLHPSDRNPDSKLIKVEIVGAQNMDLDSGGRFERRTTIIDR